MQFHALAQIIHFFNVHLESKKKHARSSILLEIFRHTFTLFYATLPPFSYNFRSKLQSVASLYDYLFYGNHLFIIVS